MEDIFLSFLNRSFVAGWMILAVVVFRMIFQKAPKNTRCILWGLVGIRLVCPFSFESILSLIPSAKVITSEIMYAKEPAIDSGISSINNIVNPVITETFRPNLAYSANPLQIYVFIAAIVWLIGIAVLLLYTTISYVHFRYLLKDAVLMDENLQQEDIEKKYIFQSDRIEQALVFGFFKPRIFVPFSLEKEELDIILAHEKTHIRRKDYLWKPLAFLVAIVYWFHPLVWVAYVLFGRDIELACDESVIKKMDLEQRKTYSKALLNCSSQKRLRVTCPLAFGENNVKHRIKNVLKYKRPSFWILISSIVIVVLAAVFFMTNPVDGNASGNDGKTENKVFVKVPPNIVLEDAVSGEKIYENPSIGTYSWWYFTGNLVKDLENPTGELREEWYGFEGCGDSPLRYIKEENYLSQAEDDLEDAMMQIKFVADSNVIVEPYKITVAVYDLAAIGNAEAVELYSQEISNSMIEIDPGRVYLLKAYWNCEDETVYAFDGNAQYVFVTK